MTTPPVIRISTSRFNSVANQFLIVPAKIPQPESKKRARSAKIAPIRISWEVIFPASRSTNCGKMAAKKTNPFGFRAIFSRSLILFLLFLFCLVLFQKKKKFGGGGGGKKSQQSCKTFDLHFYAIKQGKNVASDQFDES